MTQDEKTKELTKFQMGWRFIWTWLLRVLLFVVPVLPFLLIFYFILPGFFGFVYIALLISVFLLEFPLAVLYGVQGCAVRVLHQLQMLFCWVSIFYFLIVWTRLFPGLRLFLALWVLVLTLLTIWSYKKSTVYRASRLYVGMGLLTLVGILIYLKTNILLFGLYLLGLGALLLIVRKLSAARRLSLPAWVPIVCISMYGMMMVVGLHMYSVNQSNMVEDIAAQDGVFRIDPDWYDPQRLRDHEKQTTRWDIRELIFPSHDYVAFLPYGDNLLLLPQHELQVLRLHRREGVFVLPTENVAADNLVVDPAARCYYFVMGNGLYRGWTDSSVMDEIHLFSEVWLTTTTPSFVRGWPESNVKQLLVQYGNDTGFMLYDLAKRQAVRFDLGTIVHDSIFHPSGKKIIAITNGSSIASKRYVLLDMDGNRLAEEGIFESGFVFLAPAVDDFFYTSLFIKGRLEKRSVDTLALERSFVIEPGTRGMYVLPGGKCLLTPNYLKGRVYLIDTATGESLADWWLGYRVRSITPSLDGQAYYLSSAAGLFGLDAAQVLSYCSTL